MQNGWMTGLTVALLVAAPLAAHAQSAATEKAGTRAAQATDKAQGMMDKATGAITSAAELLDLAESENDEGMASEIERDAGKLETDVRRPAIGAIQLKRNSHGCDHLGAGRFHSIVAVCPRRKITIISPRSTMRRARAPCPGAELEGIVPRRRKGSRGYGPGAGT